MALPRFSHLRAPLGVPCLQFCSPSPRRSSPARPSWPSGVSPRAVAEVFPQQKGTPCELGLAAGGRRASCAYRQPDFPTAQTGALLAADVDGKGPNRLLSTCVVFSLAFSCRIFMDWLQIFLLVVSALGILFCSHASNRPQGLCSSSVMYSYWCPD